MSRKARGENAGQDMVDIGEGLQTSRHGITFQVVRSEIGTGDARKEIGKSGDEARFFGRERLELGADFGQAGGFAVATL